MGKYDEAIKKMDDLVQETEKANYQRCLIMSANVVEARFNKDNLPNAYEIELICSVQKKLAKVYIDLKNTYPAWEVKGPAKTFRQMAFEQLSAMGIPSNGQALDKLDLLVDTRIDLYGKNTDYGLQFSISTFTVKKADAKKVMELFASETAPSPQNDSSEFDNMPVDEFTTDDIPF